MLDFVYYPISGVLWLWHTVFAAGLPDNVAWTATIVFVVLTLRALLLKPFLAQVRWQQKLVELQPQMREIQQRHTGDRAKQAEALTKLQREHGFNMLSGFVPMIAQAVVFLGLYHVLNAFDAAAAGNYFLDGGQVQSFLQANLFGAPLSATMVHAGPQLGAVAAVAVPLMGVAAVATHLTARISIARQPAATPAAPGAGMMNALALWVFPATVIVGGAFLPVAILLYWVTNNAWTLVQQQLVYRRLDKESARTKS